MRICYFVRQTNGDNVRQYAVDTHGYKNSFAFLEEEGHDIKETATTFSGTLGGGVVLLEGWIEHKEEFVLPTVEALDDLPEGSNPFHYDSSHMGTDLVRGYMVLHDGFGRPDAEDPLRYLIVVNTKTGQRFKVNLIPEPVEPKLSDLQHTVLHTLAEDMSTLAKELLQTNDLPKEQVANFNTRMQNLLEERVTEILKVQS